MIRIDQLNLTVAIEGDAEAGERAFARLYDKYNQLERDKLAQVQRQAGHMSRARSLSAGGRR